MTLKDRAAAALDATHSAAARKIGIHTDTVRDHLATYLDGALRLTAKQVRSRCSYLEMITR